MERPLAERIADMRARLKTDDGLRDPGLIAFMIRDWPETREFDLWSLAYNLSRGTYGCHVNDVLGLLEYIEIAAAKAKEQEV